MNIRRLIEPKSMAIFGISKTNPEHPANIIYEKNKKHFKTKIFCVNPGGGAFRGEKLYRNIGEVPEHIDAAVLVIRSDQVPGVLKECIAAGVSGGIIISGGFSEAGRDDLQESVRELCLENNFPVIGPNGLGVFSVPYINTLFFPDDRFVQPLDGVIGLASQSGGILVDLLIRFTREGVGISHALSIGNKAVIDEVDALRFFREDEKTRVIGLYFEGFTRHRGRDFIRELKDTDKPVVIFKAGKTPSSMNAVSTHTAAIAGDYRVFSQVIGETGALEVITEPDFLAACEALSHYGKRKIENVAIITLSGGHGVTASDYCHDSGLNVISIPEQDRKKLRDSCSRNIHAIASFTNPVDLTGSATDDDYFKAVKFTLERHYIDGLIILFLPFIPAISSALPARLAKLRQDHDKPIICYIPYLPKYEMFIEGFETHGIPVTHSIDSAVKMMKAIKRNR
jgi:acyl-CoA synthetase (NDP forming)